MTWIVAQHVQSTLNIDSVCTLPKRTNAFSYIIPLMNDISSIIRHTNLCRYIILGELHGTVQTPALLEQVLEAYRGTENSVAFACEWDVPQEAASALIAYLTHDATVTAQQVDDAFRALNTDHSGVFSDQHRAFLERVRQVNRDRDEAIRVICFGNGVDEWNRRDEQMAHTIHEQGSELDTVFVVTGSLHAKRRPFRLAGDTADRIPMASHFASEDSVSIRLEYDSGTFFNFGVQDYHKDSDTDDRESYDETFFVGSAQPVTRDPQQRTAPPSHE